MRMHDRDGTLGGAYIAAALVVIALVSRASAQTRIRLGTLVPSGTSYYHSLESMGAWRFSY